MIGWVDASSGASGDMLLGALVGAGVPVEVLADAVRAVAPEHVALAASTVSRHGFAAEPVAPAFRTIRGRTRSGRRASPAPARDG